VWSFSYEAELPSGCMNCYTTPGLAPVVWSLLAFAPSSSSSPVPDLPTDDGTIIRSSSRKQDNRQDLENRNRRINSKSCLQVLFRRGKVGALMHLLLFFASGIVACFRALVLFVPRCFFFFVPWIRQWRCEVGERVVRRVDRRLSA
jgi:hypothetical protein